MAMPVRSDQDAGGDDIDGGLHRSAADELGAERPHVVDRQHGVFAAEADVVECAARAFRRGALEHRLEVMIGQADGARLVVTLWGHDVVLWLKIVDRRGMLTP
jgi:hypothetical protein